MKPTTQARIDRVMAAAGFPPSIDQPLREAVILALREQDRDTRHACAEAMLKLPHDMQHMDAHQACINTQAV